MQVERGSHLAALMLHLVGKGLEQGGLSGARGSQQQGHAAGLDGAADVVQQDEPVLAGADADPAQGRLQSDAFDIMNCRH